MPSLTNENIERAAATDLTKTLRLLGAKRHPDEPKRYDLTTLQGKEVSEYRFRLEANQYWNEELRDLRGFGAITAAQLILGTSLQEVVDFLTLAATWRDELNDAHIEEKRSTEQSFFSLISRRDDGLRNEGMSWLQEVWGIDPFILHDLRKSGKLLTHKHALGSAVCFMQSDPTPRLLNPGENFVFRPRDPRVTQFLSGTLGKEKAFFINETSKGPLVLTLDAIEAISFYQKHRKLENFTVVSLANHKVDWNWLPKDRPIFVAYPATPEGDLATQLILEKYPKAMRVRPSNGACWNVDL
ncbi:hypothetical protein [Gimibacter soli]|uniref:Uncharacterized protein n=1 Tax=Gimibacter soli TaxID=3024400 RepID=A0AAF0BJT7_9PROT|nr:hypothetical protein [Gimibacter soli]WCL53489.1 hypothetical protein PH603_13170 [Gimibacter soli]